MYNNYTYTYKIYALAFYFFQRFSVQNIDLSDRPISAKIYFKTKSRIFIPINAQSDAYNNVLTKLAHDLPAVSYTLR